MNKEDNNITERKTDQIQHNQHRYDQLLEENEALKKQVQDLHHSLDEAFAEVKNTKRLVNQQVASKLHLLDKVSPYVKNVSMFINLPERAIMENTMKYISNKEEDYSEHSDEMVRGIFLEFMKNQSRKELEEEARKLDEKCYEKKEAQSTHDPLSNRTIHEILAERVHNDFMEERLKQSRERPWTSDKSKF